MNTQDRIQWEIEVYNEISNLGEMDSGDAQGIVEAKEMQGEDPLQYAWDNGMTPEQAAEFILA